MTLQVQGHPWSMIACQDVRDWCSFGAHTAGNSFVANFVVNQSVKEF